MNKKIEDIINRGSADLATVKEQQDLNELYHRPDVEYEFKSALFSKLNNTQPIENQKLFAEIFGKILHRIESKKLKSRKLFIKNVSKIAATLVIGVLAGYFIFHQPDKESHFLLAKAPAGSVSQVVLPDKSIVYLNSDSEIKYAVDNKKIREVFLTGEAWFHVEKDTDKPFQVHTDFYNIQVLGTEFNVKAYYSDNEVATTLVKGSVKIYGNDNLKLERDVELRPGEQLVYNKKTKSIDIKEVNTNWFTSWKDNRIVFVNMEFKDLVILLERKYGVDISVMDESVFNFHYDGTIKNESIFEILDIIKQTLPINYRIVGQKIEICKK